MVIQMQQRPSMQKPTAKFSLIYYHMWLAGKERCPSSPLFTNIKQYLLRSTLQDYRSYEVNLLSAGHECLFAELIPLGCNATGRANR